MRFILGIFVLFLTQVLPAQEKKSVEALFISTPLVIDGIPDEEVYARSQAARDFQQIWPLNGKPAFQPSEIHIFYDHSAIYVGAILYDNSPDSIFNFFSERDNLGMSDYFGIYFDPYNQGQLAYGFFITPAGVQVDMKAVKSEYDNEDDSWNAVWQSKTRITDKGWVAELRIPYSALRFPENGGGTWGLQMFRRIRRYNSNSSWNFINREVSGFIHQEGQLTGIRDIKPPLRLSLSPYAAAYSEFKGNGSAVDYTYKGGMDLKYGISESFTLDMMLIPDFGQIQSDDKQLNLSPYELYYSEKRQFFNEGTELFQRGDIFYSRRIGSGPRFAQKASDELGATEKIIYNPTETQLVNSTKISGRTAGGWGLGILNAMSLQSFASLRDTVSGHERKVQIQPFTNYNVSVIDKSLKNNSYFSLINTNVSMIGNPFKANVTATDFQLRNKAKTIAIKGKGGISTRNEDGHETGFFTGLGIEKNKGKLLYGISETIYSDKYNPNDLGYLQRNNEMRTETYVNYNIIEPFGVFKEMHTYSYWDHIRMYRHNDLFDNEFGIEHFSLFKNNYGVELNMRMIGNKYDYYEPRVDGRYYFAPYRFYGYFSLYSDQRKPLVLNVGIGGTKVPSTNQHKNSADFGLDLRIGKRCRLFYEFSMVNAINDRGFVDMTDSEDTVYFAIRNVKTLENTLYGTYSFTNKASISMRVRHYWSGASNKDYFRLMDDGSLEKDPGYLENQNENYNALNVDLVFRWIFAPGSEITFAWKNSILDSRNEVSEHYFDNLRETWNSDQINSLSVKILYYLDYH